MSEISIALNRYGLGYRRGQNAPSNPKQWLLNQLDNFEPTPPMLAGRRTDTTMVTKLFAEIQDARRMRRQARMAGPEGEQDLAAAVKTLRSGRQNYIEDVVLRGQVAATTDTPFAERLVHFWANHFAVSTTKPQTATLVGPHEFSAIRPHIGGKFANLLKSAVLHPAMLVYLDQFQSVGPGSPAMQRRRNRQRGNGRQRGLNENLAREILELHTLGVSGGYNQADVTEFARAMTGWTVSGIRQARRFSADFGNGTAFVSIAHEPGRRTVMGRKYAQKDHTQALAVLDDLATHPSTAKHIATKLARHFAGDEPPAAMIARLETAFLRSGGDLPTVHRALINSPEVWSDQPLKFRQPWEWTIAMMRAAGIEKLPQRRRFIGILTELGQAPWRPPSPAGYDDIGASWAAPDALVRRVEVAERVANAVPLSDVRQLAETMFPGALSSATETAIRRAESNSQALALLLVSPEMLRR